MDFGYNQSERSSQLVVLKVNIEQDVDAQLEDFVRRTHVCQCKDAHELFDKCRSSHDAWHPVAVEYEDCLLREGDSEQLAAYSEKAWTKY